MGKGKLKTSVPHDQMGVQKKANLESFAFLCAVFVLCLFLLVASNAKMRTDKETNSRKGKSEKEQSRRRRKG